MALVFNSYANTNVLSECTYEWDSKGPVVGSHPQVCALILIGLVLTMQ